MKESDRLKVSVGTRIITKPHVGGGTYRPQKVGTVIGAMCGFPIKKAHIHFNVNFDDGTHGYVTAYQCDLYKEERK